MTRKFTILRVQRPFGTLPTIGGFKGFNMTPGPDLLGAAVAHHLEFNLVAEQASLSGKQQLDLSRDPGVLSVAPNMPIRLLKPVNHLPTVAATTTAWGVSAIKADSSSRDGAGVVVAILDTGIERNHPAFGGMTFDEEDFTGAGNGDRHGHGTHCAGTVFGRSVGGVRIGVAPGITHALIGKVLDDQGAGDSGAIVDAMLWAHRLGARVISMSLGYDFVGMVQSMVADGVPIQAATSEALEAYRANLRMFDSLMGLMRSSVTAGEAAMVVAAAGNESDHHASVPYRVGASLPAVAEHVVSVGAVNRAATRFSVAPFSNTFPQVCAPGVTVISAALGGGLQPLSGTSMAAPHVAGVAALIWQSMGPKATADRVTAKLIALARDDVFVAGTDIGDTGAGLVTSPA